MKRYHYLECGSTNDVAKEFLRKRSDMDSVFAVTADVQTSGRGRNGKAWSGSAGDNVYCSIGIRHTQEKSLKELVTYQAVGCMAAQAALREVTKDSKDGNSSVTFFLKYPNDVYVQAAILSQPRKICGVLVEHEFSGSSCVASVIGIGINVRQNVFPRELAQKATSLRLIGIEHSEEHAAEELTQTLLRYCDIFLQQQTEQLFQAWREELAIENTSIQIVGESGWWQVLKLCDDGRLQAFNPTSGEQRLIDNGDSIQLSANRFQ